MITGPFDGLPGGRPDYAAGTFSVEPVFEVMRNLGSAESLCSENEKLKKKVKELQERILGLHATIERERKLRRSPLKEYTPGPRGSDDGR